MQAEQSFSITFVDLDQPTVLNGLIDSTSSLSFPGDTLSHSEAIRFSDTTVISIPDFPEGTYQLTISVGARASGVQVPEPMPLYLLGLGLAGMSYQRRRKLNG